MVEKKKTHLLLLLFCALSFTLFFFAVHAKLHLHPSDQKALSILLKDLGVNGQLQASDEPCNLDGVFCERRLSNKETYALRVTRLVFKRQRLNGVLSAAVGRLTELRELSLPDNKLVDRIPSQLVECRKLETIDLSANLFSGDVPAELSSLTRLRVLDISSNDLSGSLNFVKSFPSLESLSVANNRFAGRIPAALRSSRTLKHFNFSGNSFLQTSVDTTGNTLRKRRVLVETPTTAPATGNGPAPAPAPASNSSSHKKSSNASHNSAPAPGPSQHPKKHKHNRRKLLGWILGFVAGAIAGVLSGFVFSLLFKLAMALIKGRVRTGGPDIYSPLIKKAEDLAFLEKEEGIASLEIIGRGGSGEVYKAELPGSNGKMIAIKKIVQPPKDAAELQDEDSKLLHKKMRQIRAEINTVGHIRHRNLLPLLAHVSRPDCHYLVYEFMKNGSLQDLLSKVESGQGELDWLTRHNVALGVAAGLEYLHMSHSPRIIHRDLKPANILLDDDMEARIADFGLAKAMPDAKTHITTSNVAGTVGYIAPEYHQILKFTDKCDIYSFGVILGVLVIGRLPSDEFFQNTDEMSLVKWMRKMMTSENPKDAIDVKLLGNGYEEQMLLVLKIACFCTMDDPKERPDSKNVRCMLSQIKH